MAGRLVFVVAMTLALGMGDLGSNGVVSPVFENGGDGGQLVRRAADRETSDDSVGPAVSSCRRSMRVKSSTCPLPGVTRTFAKARFIHPRLIHAAVTQLSI